MREPRTSSSTVDPSGIVSSSASAGASGVELSALPREGAEATAAPGAEARDAGVAGRGVAERGGSHSTAEAGGSVGSTCPPTDAAVRVSSIRGGASR